jgi:hypothetical protein
MAVNRIPFTTDQFFGVFTAYNLSIDGATIALNAIAMALVWVSLRPTRWSSAVVWLGLAGLWLWTGVVFHLTHFTSVTPAAYLFGALFVAQSLLFAHAATRRIAFEPVRGAARSLGALLVVYALVMYPAIGVISGDRYPALPLFAAPCPLSIFTFGLLLWTRGRVPTYLFSIPVVWSVIASSAIFQFGVVQDVVMPIAALLTVIVLGRRQPVQVVASQAESAGPLRQEHPRVVV